MYVNDMFAYGMAFGIEKETVVDAIHDVFLHIIERNNPIDAQSNAKFYLLCSLKNRLFSIKRNEITFESLDDTGSYEFSIVVSGLENSVEDEEERNELTAQIEAMLKELTGKQREVIYLKYMQKLSYEEIAEILHITPKAVRKLNYRALDRIRERYGTTFAFFVLLSSMCKYYA